MARTLRLRSILFAYDVRYLLALAISLALYLVLRGVGAGAQEAQQTEVRIDGAIHACLESWLNQEVGLRGFLGSGEERFLEPYAQGEREEPAELERLRGALGNLRPALEPQLRVLITDAQRWHREIALPQIEQRRRGPLPDLAAALSAGKERFDALRAAADQLRQAAAPLVATEVARARRLE
jgi:CHASE3 domain sensor protein